MTPIQRRKVYMSRSKKIDRKKKEDALLQEGEDWERGRRGMESRAAKVNMENQLDTMLELQMISLRLPTPILDSLRKEATEKGIKYQPYIRQLLINHVQGVKSLEDRVSELEKKMAIGE